MLYIMFYFPQSSVYFIIKCFFINNTLKFEYISWQDKISIRTELQFLNMSTVCFDSNMKRWMQISSSSLILNPMGKIH